MAGESDSVNLEMYCSFKNVAKESTYIVNRIHRATLSMSFGPDMLKLTRTCSEREMWKRGNWYSLPRR